MARRKVAWALIAGFLGLSLIAVIAGSQALPSDFSDPRRSIHLSGPSGTSALAESLERLGVPVSAWERPVSRIPVDSAAGAWLGLIDVGDDLTEPDILRVLDWLEGGGGVLVAGDSPIAECVGFRLSFQRRSEMEDERLPASPLSWKPISGSADSAPAPRSFRNRCDGRGWRSESVFTVSNSEDAPIMALLRLSNGGRVLLLADVRYLSNEALRETATGEVIIPLLLAERPERLIVDEYHHGFGDRPSLLGTTASWLVRTPGGLAMLHLALAGTIWLAVRAVRFGPALNVVERRRRSPLEHVDALATALERANAAETAIGLVTGGLKRRLGRLSTRESSRAAHETWIDALALSARTAEAQAAVRRLAQTLDGGRNPERVLTAALAVEDVWEALRPDQRSPTS